ncbi:MAG: winged helix DNA-binding domain-containing protein, partial [Dehalococcoidia bacterium]
RELLETQPRTIGQLRSVLADRWPGYDPASLAYAVHYTLPLVQLPPRGVWRTGGRAILTTAETWLGQPLASETVPDTLILRYLAAFGPATTGDMRTWSGLSGLREVVERLRPRLRTFRDEQGRELFDLPDAPLPDPETPAPPRFLPEFDNVLLSHADRARVVSEAVRMPWTVTNAIGFGSVLVDGFMRAVWRVQRDGTAATLCLWPAEPLTDQERGDITEEGARLLAFIAADAQTHDVQFMQVEWPPRLEPRRGRATSKEDV